jgi:hypothetical protein
MPGARNPPPAIRGLGHIRLAWQFWHHTVTPERVLRNGGGTAA